MLLLQTVARTGPVFILFLLKLVADIKRLLHVTAVNLNLSRGTF
jgi:hypothetical protein